uniref:BED-type domain-containing protein n=1 Tax=Davidia involucrata TaxID=16924 RepID=A0A5B7AFB0_DAVIN
MASTGASTAPSSSSQDEDINKPLWKYVAKFDKLSDGGGNISWQCNFCHQVKKSSYTRVRAHLLRLPGQGIVACSKVTTKDILEMQKLEDEVKLRLKSNALKKVPLPHSIISLCGSTSFSQEGYDSKKRKTTSSGSGNPLEKTFNMVAHEQLHAEIARMFYSSGLPFHLARNPYYVSSFTFAANNPIMGYLPPGYNLLRTTLLQIEKENIERLLQPIKGTWKEKGVSIVSDGWSNSQRRPLINFMAVTEDGPMFLKVVDCSGETKDKYFIANLMREVINEVGHENVIQIITDNAPNCKGAGQMIESQFSNIFWTPCVVHTLNLALKNICAAKNVENNQLTYNECSWISDIAGDVMQIKHFIMNHSLRLVMFNEFVTLKLLSVADTRFASVIVMFRRFKLIKHGLQAMVISDKWSYYQEDDVGRGRFVKEKVLNDIWWDSIDYILSFTTPIYEMLKACDTDKPCLHLVYDMWDSMMEKVKIAIYRHEEKRYEESSTFYDVVHNILVDRWNKNNTPLHCLAHSLNPKYYSNEWLHENPNRVPPYKNFEISQERLKCLKRYFSNSEDRTKVTVEYAKFSTKSGDFGKVDSIHDRYIMDPKSWWVIHGSSAPMLQSLALKLLVQPSSSSCCERNWSTYSFVHSVRRNKMTPQCAEDLVFVHSNLRLLSRRTPQYMQGETKMWDIAGDTFDSFEDVGVLEVANLSLDEPELEAVVFMDDGNEREEEEEDEVGSNDA